MKLFTQGSSRYKVVRESPFKHDTSLFSRGVIVSRPWLKERRIFPQNVFLVHLQTIIEVSEIFVQFHSLRRIETTGFRHNTPLKLYTTLATATYKFLPRNKNRHQ